MSCSTLNNQVGLNVTTANLPEGFCPSSMQELLQAFGARLIVTPNQSFNGFAIGSIEPASNVGPWFKDCLELFVFDDATARYVPISVTGTFNNQQYFTASGTFIVPDFVTRIRVSAWGAGGGGGRDVPNFTIGGGGAGAYASGILTVLPAQAIAVMVGLGGAAGPPGGAGVAGGATTFLTLIAGGGFGSLGGTTTSGALGGTATGGTINITGQSGLPGAGGQGGTGGSSPKGGGGGTYITPANPLFLNGKEPGGGGAGDHAVSGAGNGANGSVLVEW